MDGREGQLMRRVSLLISLLAGCSGPSTDGSRDADAAADRTGFEESSEFDAAVDAGVPKADAPSDASMPEAEAGEAGDACVPKRCQDVAGACGAMPDQCGGTNACGDCPALRGCGEGNAPNVCATFLERCSTTTFAGAACVFVKGSSSDHRYCQPSLITQFGARHDCLPASSPLCADAGSQYRCEF
jgi:hypothetical protein